MNQTVVRLLLKAVILKGKKALKALEKIAPQACEYNNNLLMELIEQNKNTAFGIDKNFKDIHSYEDYKRLISLSDYSDYKEYVSRISEAGEQQVLTNADVVHFCPTTGTTSKPKLIPVTSKAKDLTTAYTMPAAMATGNAYLAKQGKKSFTQGKCLLIYEVGDPSYSESGISIGGVSGTAVRSSKDLIEEFCVSPHELITPDAYLECKYLHLLFALKERNITWIVSCYMTSISGLFDELVLRWEDLCHDIETGTINPDVEMSEATRASLEAKFTADPERAAELRALFEAGFSDSIALKIWPNLAIVGAIGTGSFKIHTNKVRTFIGPDIPICHLCIASSESIMAVAAGCNVEEFILLPQAAFFEFLPEGAEDETGICTMADVEVGKRYELVLTTLSGFYRYRMRDIVEVTGRFGEIPKVAFAHRQNVFLNLAGEKTTESNLFDAVQEFTKKTGIAITDYAAYVDTQKSPGHYVMLLEPSVPVDMSKMKEYEAIIEDALCLTFGYEYERRAGNIDPAVLAIQQQQTHQLYHEMQIMRGKPRNQLKPVRVLDTPERKSFFTALIETP